MQAHNQKPGMAVQAFRSTFWAYLSFAGGKALAFISTLILARLLLPEEFGMMAYCLIAIAFLNTLNAVGSDSALIARRDHLEEAANATFVINIITGVLFYIVAWLSAPMVAAFFNAPAITDMLRVLALTLPISSLDSAPRALLQRRMSFRAKLIPDLGLAFVKGTSAIILALQGFGAWSLVLGQLLGVFTSTVIFWVMVRWYPTRKFDLGVTREMAGFGGHMALIGIIGMLLNNADYIFVGRFIGTAALGYYTIAYRVPEILIRSLSHVFALVALPVLARLQSSREQLVSIYLRYVHYIALCIFPLGVGLALTSPELIRILYSDQWLPAVVPMQAIAIAIMVMSIGRISGTLYKAINQPGILSKLGIVKLVYAMPLLWYATRWGINGVAVAQIVIGIFSVLIDFYVIRRVINVQFVDLFHALMPAVLASGMMASVVIAIQSFSLLDGMLELLLLIVLGAATYIATLSIVSRQTIVQAGILVRSALSRV